MPDNSEDNINNISTITSGDDVEFYIWAKERDNYVIPLKIVAFQLKTPAKFGWNTIPRTGFEDGIGGKLFPMTLSTLKKFYPNLVEIADSGCPLSEFLSKLDDDAKTFFHNCRWLRIYECKGKIDEICAVIQNSEFLSAMELYESGFGLDERRQILKILSKKKELKAFDFVYDYGGQELNEWITNLRMQLRHIRFSGPPAVKLSAIRAVNIDLPLVEFAALQDLDVDVDDSQNSTNKKWYWDMFNRFCHVMPCVKFFYLDYKVIDTIFIYNDDTIKILETFRDFFRRMKLVLFAILIYCPDAEMKESVSKAAKFLAKDCEIRTEMKEFFCGSPTTDAEQAAPNFALLVLGDQVHARTERLVQTIVNQRNTVPDLRHFCYIMDVDAFLRPNSTLAFGGFDKELVEKTYKEKHASFSTVDFVPDIVMQRYMNG